MDEGLPRPAMRNMLLRNDEVAAPLHVPPELRRYTLRFERHLRDDPERWPNRCPKLPRRGDVAAGKRADCDDGRALAVHNAPPRCVLRRRKVGGRFVAPEPQVDRSILKRKLRDNGPYVRVECWCNHSHVLETEQRSVVFQRVMRRAHDPVSVPAAIADQSN